MEPSSKAEKFFQTGENFYKVEKYQDACDAYEQAIAESPDFARAYARWAAVLAVLERDEAAIEKAEKALEIDAYQADAYVGWGEALYHLKDYPGAIDKFQQAIALAPDLEDAYYGWGYVLGQLEQTPEALAPYQVGIKETPPFADLYNGWGRALEARKQYVAAAEQYEHARRLNSEKAVFHCNLGNMLRELKQYGQAVAAYRKAVEQAPDEDVYFGWGYTLGQLEQTLETLAPYQVGIKDKETPPFADLHDGWGQALEARKQYAAAAEQYHKAIELNSEKASFHRDLGDALQKLKQYKGAVEAYRKAIEKAPDYEWAYFGWGQLLGRQKQTLKLLHSYQEGIEETKPFAALYDGWGSALCDLKQYEVAKAKQQKATELDPDRSQSYFVLGRAQTHLKQYAEAIKTYREALKRHSDLDEWAYFGWGYTLGQLGQTSEILAPYLEHVEESVTCAHLYNGWGLALFQLEHYQLAEDKYQQAIDLNEQNADFYRYLGDAQAELKKFQEAIKQYLKAIDLCQQAPDTDWQARLSLGDTLREVNRYDEAIEQYRMVLPLPHIYPYALIDILACQWEKGDYRSVWSSKQDFFDLYKQWKGAAELEDNGEYFTRFGQAMLNFFSELESAEAAYQKGHEVAPDSVEILMGMAALYAQKKDVTLGKEGNAQEQLQKKITAHWTGVEAARKAISLLEKEINGEPTIRTQLKLGEMFIYLEDYSKAEDLLNKALDQAQKKDRKSAKIYTELGILRVRQGEGDQAVNYFEQALRLQPRNFTIASNLAESYLRQSALDKAECEYQKILKIAPEHVESNIGLAEVYIQRGEDSQDRTFYDQAIHHLKQAIAISYNREGSKVLNSQEMAEVLYMKGYARSKLLGISGPTEKIELLRCGSLLTDFEQCLSHSSENRAIYHKAKIARDKIRSRLNPFSDQGLAVGVGRMVIVALAFMILTVAQVSFFGKPEINGSVKSVKLNWIELKSIELAEYSTVTFGALAFITIGLYLPQILKLRVGAIELEKSSIDQIKTIDITSIRVESSRTSFDKSESRRGLR